MPTNQSSPWGGEKLRICSSGDGTTARISPSKRPGKVASAEVPYSQSSLQLSRKKDQAKSLASNVASSNFIGRQTTAPRPVVPESREGNKANARGQFTAGPDGFPNLPKQYHGIQNPIQVPTIDLKQAGGILADTYSSTSISRGRHTGFNGLLTGTKQTRVPLQTSQNGNCGTVRGCFDATGDGPLGSFGHQDLFIRGKPSLQLINPLMLEGADCSSSPSVPPPCLTLCDHQGAALGISGPHKTEMRSTATSRKSQKKTTTNCSQTPNSCSTAPASNTLSPVRGGPPAALAAATSSKPQTAASQGLNKLRQSPPGGSLSTCRRTGPPATSGVLNGCLPSVPSASVDATQEKPRAPVDATGDDASCPAGALVGSVTSQISTIHLTKQAESASSSFPCPSSPSQSGRCLTGETPLPGQECGLQADGLEEELPGELENACSDDCDSDCSTSSMASLPALSSVEEPMSLGVEDDREERPALVPSLFSFIPPTLYFSTANEKVELLPVEQRRLLKWKMTTVTPNVVKHTIARSHFKVTKKSHDWLGSWGHHMKSAGFRAIREHQKLNHFPGTFQIGRKDRLWRNLSKMQGRFGKQEFGFFPRTFVLPQDIKLLRKVWEDSSTRQKWIIKPPASARGIGIQVIHKWSQMPRKRPLLVQKYLHKPYLISGNKFDLRIYVYVTSYDPLRVYMFSDGLVRFASCKYSSSMKTLSNKFMHLTNYSVNKKNSEYQSNSDDKACQGHKWALKALWQYLGSQGVNTTLIREKIKDIVIKTIIASEPYVNNLLKMNVRTPYSCHELFGFDIMLDEKLKPWILEVNISPSLHSNTALDVAIKGQMIRDLLNLAGFRIPQREEVVAPSSSASSSTSSLCGGTRTRPEVSADEKVKRAFYLTQRYADQDFLSTVLDVLTPEDVRVLAESEDELSRMGQFERLFPSPSSSRYLRFFECTRYLNILLDQWEQKHRSSKSKGIALLKTLCQNGVHLGTSDPAHMWSKSSYISKIEPQKQEPVSPYRSRVVVSHQTPPLYGRGDGDGPDREVASFSSLPVSPSPESSVSSSACGSPQPGFAQSLLPHQLASL